MPTFPNPKDPQDPQQPQDPKHPTPSRWPTGDAGGVDGGASPRPERVRDQMRLFLLMLLGLVLVSQLTLPFRLGGLVLALGIGWVGIQLLSDMLALKRAGTPARGWPSVIIGLGLAAVLTLILAVQAAMYPVTADRERCLSQANTLNARELCEQEYQDRIDELTNDLRQGTTTN